MRGGLSSDEGRWSGFPYDGGVYRAGDAAPLVCVTENRCKYNLESEVFTACPIDIDDTYFLEFVDHVLCSQLV